MSILEETQNFIELHHYISQSGKTEIPSEYLYWSCISLIAAAVQDRVWVKKMGNKLFPNMYVFLIGPSALGKGAAIDSVGNVGRSNQQLHWFNTTRTAKSLLDRMTRPDKTGREGTKTYSWSKVYVVMTELGFNIGSGSKADDFVKFMTSIYSGNPEEVIDEGTRMSGEHSMPQPTVNWLAGTTKEWMLESISRASLYGGFLGRCACVLSNYNLDNRVYELPKPKDHDQVMQYLRGRLLALTQIRNLEIKISNQAHDVIRSWYLGRPSPDPEDPMASSWKREHDFILKLCAILVLADQRDLITSSDFVQAERMSRSLMNKLPDLIVYAGATTENEALHRARALLARMKQIKKSIMLKQLDITSERMQQVINTLEEAQQIKLQRHTGGTLANPIVIWQGDPGKHIEVNFNEVGIEQSGIDENP